MPNPSREKGDRREREMVTSLNALGIKASRVPLSGSLGGEYRGDLTVPVGPWNLVAEVKARKTGAGWKLIESWTHNRDMLFLVRDRAAPLVVLPWSVFEFLLTRANDATFTRKPGSVLEPSVRTALER